MTEPTNIIMGFDPCGKGNFGWSVCAFLETYPQGNKVRKRFTPKKLINTAKNPAKLERNWSYPTRSRNGSGVV